MRRLEVVTTEEQEALTHILNLFDLRGTLKGLKRLYQGHLHSTYIGEWIENKKTSGLYIHQRINTEAFKQTQAMLENTSLVLEFINKQPDYCFPAKLFLVHGKTGEPFVQSDGDYWRTYNFVEQSISFDTCPEVSHAEMLGKATGDFLYLLRDLPPDSLADHSPFFQDTDRRWQQLEEAMRAAETQKREASSSLLSEVSSALSEAVRISHALSDGTLREQVIHGDTKINNFLFREDSSEVLCLVDIDLCMGGSPLIDFGDLVRSACAIGREDEPDIANVGVDEVLLAAVTSGFLASRLELTEPELELLPLAGFTISFNLTIRFLADFLAGDRYFPVARPHHNLERANAQWKVTQGLYGAQEVVRGAIQKKSGIV